MDIAHVLDTMYSQAECLVAQNAELCETAGKKIAEQGQAMICALMPKPAPKPDGKHPAP